MWPAQQSWLSTHKEIYNGTRLQRITICVQELCICIILHVWHLMLSIARQFSEYFSNTFWNDIIMLYKQSKFILRFFFFQLVFILVEWIFNISIGINMWIYLQFNISMFNDCVIHHDYWCKSYLFNLICCPPVYIDIQLDNLMSGNLLFNDWSTMGYHQNLDLMCLHVGYFLSLI